MGRKVSFRVSQDVRASLERIYQRNPDWRQRERALTLLLLDQGMSMSEVAIEVGVHVRTVGSTRIEWLKNEFASLPDLARCGAPKKLTPEQINAIVQDAREEPLSSRAVLAKHVQREGEPVHLNTIKATLKKANLVWKRTRHSLKKKEARPPSEQPRHTS